VPKAPVATVFVAPKGLCPNAEVGCGCVAPNPGVAPVLPPNPPKAPVVLEVVPPNVEG
jgi:hypothetical protein